MFKPRVFILFGAPGSGKSFALEYYNKKHGIRFKTITKESTRLARNDEKDVECVKNISENCDFRYSQYGYDYGFSSREIWTLFSQKHNSALIANDLRTVRLLKRKFGPLARTIYVHSNMNKQQLSSLMKIRYPNKSPKFLKTEMDKRIEKIKTVHRKYIENTSLFDYTILNTYLEPNKESEERLFNQLNNIIIDDSLEQRRIKSSVKIFIIVGGTYSGKDELVVAMQQIEKSRIVNYPKATNRPKRQDDRGELRHFEFNIPEEFNITYSKQGFIYGISTQEIWGSLAEGKANLLIVSDFEAIDKIVKEFGNICTIIYLHANFDLEEIKTTMLDQGVPEKEADDRILTIQNLQKMYAEQMPKFDHVLLNTVEPEDLYDQAFNIVDYYQGT